MEHAFFYSNLTPLNAELHKDLKISGTQSYEFAAKVNSLPLTTGEFAEACKEYPIAFAKIGERQFVPVAVLGLENAENSFVDESGRWNARYIPAFARRYPFIPAQGEDEQSLTVCIDSSCPRFNNGDGEPLFVEGAPSTYLSGVVTFLQEYQQYSQRTRQFGKSLVDLELLVERQANCTTQDGRQFHLTGLWLVDDAALQALDQSRVRELFVSGELALIYLHMTSMSNLNYLMQRKVDPQVP